MNNIFELTNNTIGWYTILTKNDAILLIISIEPIETMSATYSYYSYSEEPQVEASGVEPQEEASGVEPQVEGSGVEPQVEAPSKALPEASQEEPPEASQEVEVGMECDICQEREGEKCRRCTCRVCLGCLSEMMQSGNSSCPQCTLANFLSATPTPPAPPPVADATILRQRYKRYKSRYAFVAGTVAVIVLLMTVAMCIILHYGRELFVHPCGPRGPWSPTLAQCQPPHRSSPCVDYSPREGCVNQAQKERYDAEGGYPRALYLYKVIAVLGLIPAVMTYALYTFDMFYLRRMYGRWVGLRPILGCLSITGFALMFVVGLAFVIGVKASIGKGWSEGTFISTTAFISIVHSILLFFHIFNTGANNCGMRP